MTNIIAAIIITVGTNWHQIGTFRWSNGYEDLKVEEGRLATNTTAIIEWRGQRKEFLIDCQEGPVVGERKVPTFQTNYIKTWPWPFITNIEFKGYTVTNGVCQ